MGYRFSGGNTGNHSGFVPQKRSAYVPDGARRCKACGSLVAKGKHCKRCRDAKEAETAMARLNEVAVTASGTKAERASVAGTCAPAHYIPSYVAIGCKCTACGNLFSSYSRLDGDTALCPRCRPGKCIGCGAEFEQPKAGRTRKFCYECRPMQGKKDARKEDAND